MFNQINNQSNDKKEESKTKGENEEKHLERKESQKSQRINNQVAPKDLRADLKQKKEESIDQSRLNFQFSEKVKKYNKHYFKILEHLKDSSWVTGEQKNTKLGKLCQDMINDYPCLKAFNFKKEGGLRHFKKVNETTISCFTLEEGDKKRSTSFIWSES